MRMHASASCGGSSDGDPGRQWDALREPVVAEMPCNGRAALLKRWSGAQNYLWRWSSGLCPWPGARGDEGKRQGLCARGLTRGRCSQPQLVGVKLLER